MEGPEWDAQAHVTVQPYRGAEETEISGEGGEGGHRQGFQHLWAPPGDGDLLQIPGTGALGGRRRLSGVGNELVPGKGGLEEDDAHPQPGGGGAAGVRLIFKAVVQAVLLSRSETWVVTPHMGKALGGFQDHVER